MMKKRTNAKTAKNVTERDCGRSIEIVAPKMTAVQRLMIDQFF